MDNDDKTPAAANGEAIAKELADYDQFCLRMMEEYITERANKLSKLAEGLTELAKDLDGLKLLDEQAKEAANLAEELTKLVDKLITIGRQLWIL